MQRRMVWRLTVLLACALAIPLVPAVAQTGGQPGPAAPLASPIVTLDKDRLFQNSRMGKAMQGRFEAASNDLVAENRKLEAALEEEERRLTERRATTTPEAFRPLADEFDRRVEELRQAQDAKSRSLTRSRDSEQQRFFEAAVPILGNLMVELGAVAIIDRSAIILSFDQIDVTDQAIVRLDEALGDGPPPDPLPAEEDGNSAPTPDEPAAPVPSQP